MVVEFILFDTTIDTPSTHFLVKNGTMPFWNVLFHLIGGTFQCPLSTSLLLFKQNIEKS